jgi:hypothetical protein
MRTPLVRPRSTEQSSPFERLKSNLETVDCITGVFWRSELRRLAPLLAPDERVEAIVTASDSGDPALAAVTDARLIVVSDTRARSIPHGTTTQLTATSDWAGDFNLTFVREDGDVVLTDITEEDARRLYAHLRVRDRVPGVAAGGKGVSKLNVSKPKAAWFTDALPDPRATWTSCGGGGCSKQSTNAGRIGARFPGSRTRCSSAPPSRPASRSQRW